MNEAKLIKSKLGNLKKDLKANPTIANAQATVSALFLSDKIVDCNMDDYDVLGLDTNIRDKEASEDQAANYIDTDDDSYYKKEDKQILANVRTSNCEYFINCTTVMPDDVIDFIDGLIDNEIGSNTYGQIEDDADIDFAKHKNEALQKFSKLNLTEAN